MLADEKEVFLQLPKNTFCYKNDNDNNEKHQIYANKVAGESIQPSPDVFDVLLTEPRVSC